jgi:hypothetical protein
LRYAGLWARQRELLVAGAPLRVKVRSCRKLPDADPVRYRVDGRWVSLPRTQREALGIES